MLFHQPAQSLLILIVVLQEGINVTDAVEVVVNQGFFVVVGQIAGDEFLINPQEAQHGVVLVRQADRDKLVGRQPPVGSIPCGRHIIGGSHCLIIGGHPMEYKVENRRLVLDIRDVGQGFLLKQHQVILHGGAFQLGCRTQGLGKMPVDGLAEVPNAPIAHLRRVEVAVNVGVALNDPF